jgi:hypothetical protein
LLLHLFNRESIRLPVPEPLPEPLRITFQDVVPGLDEMEETLIAIDAPAVL